jgi:hypothetical protein
MSRPLGFSSSRSAQNKLPFWSAVILSNGKAASVDAASALKPSLKVR